MLVAKTILRHRVVERKGVWSRSVWAQLTGMCRRSRSHRPFARSRRCQVWPVCNGQPAAYRLEVVRSLAVGVGVLSLALVLSGCTSSGPSLRSISPGSAANHSLSGSATKSWPTETGKVPLRLHVPAAWYVTPFVGAPAPTFFPLVYMSGTALPNGCPGQPDIHSRHGSTTCFNGNWPVPGDGFIIRWGQGANPSPAAFRFAPGRRVTLSGHRARLYEGVATGDCVSSGGASEIDATILRSRSGYETFAMYACLGPHAPQTVRTEIHAMLKTLKIT